MKNLLMQDESVRENCNIILRGSYPEIAKKLSRQLLLALDELEAAQQNVQRIGGTSCRWCNKPESEHTPRMRHKFTANR